MRSGKYFSSINHVNDLLAGNAIIIKKTRNYSNFMLQNGFLRMLTLAGTIAVANLVWASLKKIKNNNIPKTKNLVLLKLRI
jgi:hypothetical protein